MAADPQRDQNPKRGGQRDRGADGLPRQARPRDALGRPLPHGDPHGVPPVSEEALPPTRALELAQSLLDAGRAFSAHEVLEAVWKAAPPAERDLWQGLAQVCVGITHHQRGNPTGMVTLFDRAARFVDRLPGAGAEVFLDDLASQEIPEDTLAEHAPEGEAVR